MVLLALGIPLAINLQQRATNQLETDTLVNALRVASAIGVESLAPERYDRLHEVVTQAAEQLGARVLVVDANGIVVDDSDGPGTIGDRYATPLRPEIVNALNGVADSRIRHSTTLGTDLMAVAVPIQDEGLLAGAVRITQPMGNVRSDTRQAWYGLAAVGFVALGAGLLLAFALAGSLSRPLRKLAGAAQELGEGDLTVRAEDVGGADEIEQLGRSFDDMAERLELTVHAQREFVANASHQLRTPLTGIKLRLESAIEAAPSDDLRRQLEAADREVDRLAEIVDRLLVMAKQIEEGQPTRVDVGEAVTRAVGRWEERASRLGATLLARGEGGTAEGNPADLDQIIDNLLDNAIAYAPGEITLESGRTDGRAFVAVQDRGPGLPAEDIERVTQRFYRGRGAPSGGSGLGLAIARQLAEKWGGSLAIRNVAEGGLRIEVRLRPITP